MHRDTSPAMAPAVTTWNREPFEKISIAGQISTTIVHASSFRCSPPADIHACWTGRSILALSLKSEVRSWGAEGLLQASSPVGYLPYLHGMTT